MGLKIDYSLSRATKVVVIIHLCIAFTLLSWLLLRPTLLQHAMQKADLSLYSKIVADEELFRTLPEADQEKIRADYANCLTKKTKPPLPLHRSPLTLGWAALSVVIGVCLLLRITGSQIMAFSLPVIVLCFSYFSLFSPPAAFEDGFFPGEEEVLSYLESPPTLKERKEALKLGWELYLIDKWAGEVPHSDPQIRATQFERGAFAFHVRRLLQGNPSVEVFAMLHNRPPSVVMLLAYLGWNLFFAIFVNRKGAYKLREFAC